ncbi:hypothetical protein ENC19_01480 [Verrucosispora sp. CWR15]|uniref:Uncharacterized protein n=1 Tax=Verrucosispora sioxanthis TaxID=2499994 RepID=A0A6M1L4K9_9ACTN|nr:hypothetical protein [Verrucosispora sioxanthis]NEE62334.1 hypothetical protein [Verrucosispora sioxanthis]NGM11444.1 hypothetical protein [Verrucosispora sioxanthis]
MTDQTVAVAAVEPATADEATVPTPARPRRVRVVAGRVRRGFAAIPAVLTDGAVLAFALWTLLYHAALLLDLAPSLTLRTWLMTGPALALLAVATRLALRWRRRRRAARPTGTTVATGDTPTLPSRRRTGAPTPTSTASTRPPRRSRVATERPTPPQPGRGTRPRVTRLRGPTARTSHGCRWRSAC